VKYLLDTNVCIKLLNGDAPSVAQRLAQHEPEEICLCTIVQLELYYGAYRGTQTERNISKLSRFFTQFLVLPFDESAAQIAGKVRSQLNTLGTPIGGYDLQIAAIALSHNLILVTHNTREFSRVEGLQWEDWEAEVI
jgi:tRNA(fMet)-specific endonuclease VapC